MTKEARIGSAGLFSLLFLCRMLTTVTFSPFLGDSHLEGDSIINILFACIFIAVLSIPSALFFRRFPENNPVNLIKKTGLSKAVSLFYWLVFLFFASVSLSRFFIFTTGIIFPEKNMNLFLVIAVAMCSYCSFFGIEALTRGNMILLAFTVIGVSAILFSVTGKFSVYNLEPIFFRPFSESVINGLSAAGRTAEAAAFLFLASKTNGKIGRGFFICLACFFVSLSVLFLFLNGVSGEFAKTQLFPFYSLAVIAQFPFFERLDAVATALWIFAILVKTSLFIYISGNLISDSFGLDKRISAAVCFVIISLLSFVFSINTGVHRAVCSPLITGVLTFSSVFVIPSLLLLKKGKGSDAV